MRVATLAAAFVLFAATAFAQEPTLQVNQHGKIITKALDDVTIRLLGFSPEAESAIVTIVGNHTPNHPEDAPHCRAIRPSSIEVPLNQGGGTAVWRFNNRFHPFYHLRCLVVADDGMGNTAEARIIATGGTHHLTLEPATVEAGQTTEVRVQAWIASGYSNDSMGSDFAILPLSTNTQRIDVDQIMVDIVAECPGVTPNRATLRFFRHPDIRGHRTAGNWEVSAPEPVTCTVRVDHPHFEATATLSVVEVVPPDTPLDVKVTPGDRSLRVDWNEVAGATSYEVQWREASARFASSARSPLQSSFNTLVVETNYAVIEDLDNGSDYVVRVRAIKGETPGEWSEEDTATAGDPEPVPAIPAAGVWMLLSLLGAGGLLRLHRATIAPR